MRFILFLLLFIPGLVKPEGKPEQDDLPGRYAVLFSINNLTLGKFNGGAGFKFRSGGLFAVSGKLNFSFEQYKEDKTQTMNGNDNKSTGYGFSASLEHYFTGLKRLSPYVSLNIGVDYEKVTQKILAPSIYMYYIENEIVSSAYSYSLGVSLGMEYFISRDISLAGQYSLGISYSEGEKTYITSYTKNVVGVKEVKAGVSAVGVVLGVYF